MADNNKGAVIQRSAPSYAPNDQQIQVNTQPLVMKMMIVEVLWSLSFCPVPNYQQIKVNTRSVKVENQSKARMVTHEDVGQVFKIKVVFGDSLQHMAINNLNDVWNILWKSTIPLW